MIENTVERKLRVIFCADVKGYSRMTGEDEVGTFHTLSSYLEIILSAKFERGLTRLSEPMARKLADNCWQKNFMRGRK